MMIDNNLAAFEDLQDRRLMKAIKHLRSFLEEQNFSNLIPELDDIESTAKAMLHYMELNADDPERMSLYHNLLKSAYRVYADADQAWYCVSHSFYRDLRINSNKSCLTLDFLTETLESFVSDLAMLSLNSNPDEVSRKKSEIYERHYKTMETLFNSVVISCQMSNEMHDYWTNILTSPTIDVSDAQLLVSALTLSTIREFDINKTRILADVYANATDTALRQRALIGFVLSVDDRMMSVYPELERVIERVSALPGAAREMMELQKQIFYCLNAERDKKKIENEIIPNLTGKSPFRINGRGMIEERETNKMQDILNPDAEDKAMEQIEESMQKISDMQKQGADIYFGGFSHMKRFPFFASVSNWFLPYFPDQPDVARARQNMDGGKFVDVLISKSAFCESDKYSLTFAMESIYNHMPPNLREALSSADMLKENIPKEETESPTYIRRQYLQDLYRFFNLHLQHEGMPNPFDSDRFTLFFASKAFMVPELKKFLPSFALFLHDQGRYDEMEKILMIFSEKQRNTLTYNILLGSYYDYTGDYDFAAHAFSKALEKAPDNEMALRGAARVGMLAEEFDMAAEAYGKLLKLYPGRKSFLVNRSLALINLGEYDEAAKSLYEADYKYPNDKYVIRTKAWLFMYRKEPSKALELYRMLTANDPAPDDYLNMGYAFWVMGNYGEAAKAFRTFHNKKKDKDDDKFIDDKSLLEKYGIHEDDCDIMKELVEVNE